MTMTTMMMMMMMMMMMITTTTIMMMVMMMMMMMMMTNVAVLFSFKMGQDVETLVAKESLGFGHLTVHFHSPVLRHKMTLTSTKQNRKLRKLLPRFDGTMMAAVGNCLVTIAADYTETKRLEFPAEVGSENYRNNCFFFGLLVSDFGCH
jgi:hypothetical protein